MGVHVPVRNKILSDIASRSCEELKLLRLRLARTRNYKWYYELCCSRRIKVWLGTYSSPRFALGKHKIYLAFFPCRCSPAVCAQLILREVHCEIRFRPLVQYLVPLTVVYGRRSKLWTPPWHLLTG